MGDLLLSLPVASAIRRALPSSEVTLLIREELRPLLEGHPDVHRLLTLDPTCSHQGLRSAFPLAGRLRPFRFDAALVLNPSKVLHLACFLAGIPVRIGYRRKWGFLLSRSIPDTKALRTLHEVDFNLELARLLGITADRREVVLPVKPALQAEAIRLLESCGVRPEGRPIAIHPWTSNPAKGWPMERFLETARRLREEGRDLLWIGEPDAAAPEAGLPPGVVNLCRRIPLSLLPEVLRRCAVLISNDSGPVHIAAAVGTPTVVVAPREHARPLERWRPIGATHRILLAPEVRDVLAALPRRDPTGSGL